MLEIGDLVIKQYTTMVVLGFHTLLLCAAVFGLAARSGLWLLAPLVGWLCSPLLLLFLRLALEDGKPKGLFSLKKQSWAFLIGDTVFLPLALAVFARGAVKWRDDDGFVAHSSLGWWALCLLIGVLAGYVFNTVDGTNYIKKGARGALSSPTKIAHDFVAYPVYVSSLFFLGVPLLGDLGTTWAVVAVGMIAVVCWLVLCICDALRGLNPHDLHPLWDPERFEPQRPKASSRLV